MVYMDNNPQNKTREIDAHDFNRLEGQLFTAVKQRNEFLRKIGKWKQDQSSGI